MSRTSGGQNSKRKISSPPPSHLRVLWETHSSPLPGSHGSWYSWLSWLVAPLIQSLPLSSHCLLYVFHQSQISLRLPFTSTLVTGFRTHMDNPGLSHLNHLKVPHLITSVQTFFQIGNINTFYGFDVGYLLGGYIWPTTNIYKSTREKRNSKSFQKFENVSSNFQFSLFGFPIKKTMAVQVVSFRKELKRIRLGFWKGWNRKGKGYIIESFIALTNLGTILRELWEVT